MNEFALLGIVGGSVFAVFLVMFIIWFILNRAGRTEDMVACVPTTYDTIYGVHVEQMGKLPGYKATITDKVYTKGIDSSFSHVATGLGLDTSNAVSFMVYATNKDSTMYIFRTKKRFTPSKVSDIAGIKTDGRGTYFPAGHPATMFAGYGIECPNNRLVIIAKNRNDVATAAELSKKRDPEGMLKVIGTTGRMAMRSQFFRIHLLKPSEPPKSEAGQPIAGRSAVDKLDQSYYKTTVFATWCTFGSTGLRVQAGIEMQDSEAATELVTAMKEKFSDGENADVSTDLKMTVPEANMKIQWGEFMQYLKFKSSSKCAYLESKIDNETGRTVFFDRFIGPIEDARAKPQQN